MKAIKKKPKAARRKVPHHRTALGREQRARKAAHIVNVAIKVFAKRGAFGIVIDDFVRAAGISRGTFYNYFQTTEELLEAAISKMSNDFIVTIIPLIDIYDNPVLRFTTAARLYYRKAELDPVFAGFISLMIHMGPLAGENARMDIDNAIRKKLVKVASADAAFLSATGTMQFAIRHLVLHPEREHIPGTEILRVILHSWNVTPGLIKKALAIPLPKVQYPS